jgi:uncharacterized membrane protein
MRTWRLDSTALLLLEFAVVTGPTLALAPAPVRVIVAVLLFGVVPGYAVVRPLRLQANDVTALLSVACSLSLTVLVSIALIYATIWSWPLCAVVLAMVTVGGVLLNARQVEP